MTTRRRAPRVALMTAVVAAVAVASVGSAYAIANGKPVPDGQFTFAVKLTMTGIPTSTGGKRNSACSGVLIDPEWIMTAGHCFRDANGKRVNRPVADVTTATVGRTDLTGPGGVRVRVVAVRQSATNDIALAKLNRRITTIKPVSLRRYVPAAGQVLRLAGYGSLTGADPVPATRLQTGTFRVTRVAAQTIGVTGRAPQRNTSACPYDSGAPYFVKQPGKTAVLVAVESTGPTCPHAGEETAARVDTVLPWVRRTMSSV